MSFIANRSYFVLYDIQSFVCIKMLWIDFLSITKNLNINIRRKKINLVLTITDSIAKQLYAHKKNMRFSE